MICTRGNHPHRRRAWNMAPRRGCGPGPRVAEAMPVNAQTRRPYRGINFTLLALQAAAQGYASNRWATYRQAWSWVARCARARPARPSSSGSCARSRPPPRRFPTPTRSKLAEQGVSAAARVHRVQRGPDRRPGASVERQQAPGLAAEARAEELLLMSAANVRHGGVEGLLPAGHRRDPAAAPTGVPDGRRLLQRGAARADALDGPSYPLRARLLRPLPRCGLRGGGARRGDGRGVPVRPLPDRRRAAACELPVESGSRSCAADKRAIFTAAAKAQQAADYVLQLADPTKDARAGRLTTSTPPEGHGSPRGLRHF